MNPTQEHQEQKEKAFKELNGPKAPKKISREEQRRMDRVNQEADQVYKSMTQKFLSFFLENENPTADEVKEYQRQLSAKWRLFCNRKVLIAAAYPALDQYCDGVIKEYEDLKAVREPKKETAVEVAQQVLAPKLPEATTNEVDSSRAICGAI